MIARAARPRYAIKFNGRNACPLGRMYYTACSIARASKPRLGGLASYLAPWGAAVIHQIQRPAPAGGTFGGRKHDFAFANGALAPAARATRGGRRRRRHAAVGAPGHRPGKADQGRLAAAL